MTSSILNNRSFIDAFSRSKENYPSFELYDPTSLDNLKEKDLSTFFSYNDEIKELRGDNKSKLSKKAPSKSTDFIHFIWMGNPIKEEYLENILFWQNFYQKKEIIIWVDQDSLKDQKLIQFAKKNNIKLIDIEKVFQNEYTFNLSEIIKLEKNRLPPNWGAVSDIYRYLIMYYFAGIYSDTDQILKESDTKFDFDQDFAFHNFNFTNDGILFFNNDRLMTKSIKQDFWKKVLEKIKYNYSLPTKCVSQFRKRLTIGFTGPSLLIQCIEQYLVPKHGSIKNYIQKFFTPNKPKIQQLKYKIISDRTWCSKLTDQKCETLAKTKKIEKRIISNLLVDLKEKKLLDLQKYDNIILKNPNLSKEKILNKLKDKLDKKELKGFIFAKNLKEFEEFSKLLSLKNIDSHDQGFIVAKIFKKSLTRKNLDMFNYYFEKYPNELFNFHITVYSETIMKKLLKLNQKIFFNVLEYAKKNNKKICLHKITKNPKYNYLDLSPYLHLN